MIEKPEVKDFRFSLFCGQALHHVIMGGIFKSIVQRRKLHGAVFPFQSQLQNMVAEGRILGQQAAVGIGGKDIFVSSAFRTVVPIIAAAGDDFTQRLDAAAKGHMTGMVLKANHSDAQLIAGKGTVAHKPLFLVLGFHIQNTKPLQILAFGSYIALAQQLISAIDGKNRYTGFHCGRKGLGLCCRRFSISRGCTKG